MLENVCGRIKGSDLDEKEILTVDLKDIDAWEIMCEIRGMTLVGINSVETKQQRKESEE